MQSALQATMPAISDDPKRICRKNNGDATTTAA